MKIEKNDNQRKITIHTPVEIETVEKKSRFIANLAPAKDENEAKEHIEKIKKRFSDATHNVYAYYIDHGTYARYSDDGEPQGTAGMPTLNALKMSGLTDICVVVTRYFGGILLGTGGLVRAYTKGASIALKAGNIITMQSCSICSLSCDYTRYGRLSGLIPSFGGVIDSTDFGADVTLNFHIAPENYGAFSKQLAELTCGNVTAEIIDEKFFEMSSDE